jgi:hypothetical protein
LLLFFTIPHLGLAIFSQLLKDPANQHIESPSSTTQCMSTHSFKKVSGLVMALSSAIFWGISGTCAQFLFKTKALILLG